jgi:hypothetical protein
LIVQLDKPGENALHKHCHSHLPLHLHLHGLTAYLREDQLEPSWLSLIKCLPYPAQLATQAKTGPIDKESQVPSGLVTTSSIQSISASPFGQYA